MKKLKRIVASLLAVLMLLGVAPVTALAGEIELHRINTTQQPAEEPAQEPVLSSEDVLPEEDIAEAAEPAAVSGSSEFYRIVHLDCGREYFTKQWIIALINEMSAAGYNQLQLAFGNGGFRFCLDDMAVSGYTNEQVKNAIEAGNEHYNTYGDDEKGPTNGEWIAYNPEVNSLTESEMNEIISHAQAKGIEIVPMFNTPGHMHALLAAMQELGMSDVSVKNGCMNLSNTSAVSFTKELVEKYVSYFKSKGCNYFHLATDEYSSFNTAFYSYANSLVDIAVAHKVTPRVFNDSFQTNGSTYIKKNSNYPTQVCYWYNGNGSVSANVVNNAGYSLINTNHDYYYVSTNEYWNLYREGYTFVGDYNESTWIKKAEDFSNTVFHGTNINSPAGSMFCIWCNTPGKNTETEIAEQIRMILRVLGARMQNSYSYSDSSVIVEGGFNKDGTINGGTPTEPKPDTTIQDGNGHESIFEIIINALLKIFLPKGTTATWTVTEGTDVVELVADGAAAAQTRSAEPAAAAETAAIRGNAVQVRALKAGTATITATLDDGTEVTATVTVKDNTKKDITVTVGGTEKVTIEGKHAGTYATANPETATVTAEYESVAGGTTRVLGDKVSLYNANSGTYTGVLKTESGNNFIKIDENGNISNVTDVNEATIFDVTKSSYYYSTIYTIKVKDKNLYLYRSNNNSLTTSSSSTSWSVESGHNFYYNYSYFTHYYIYFNNTSWTLQSSVSDGGNCAYLYNVTEETTQAKDQTILTFTGHKVGTTTVTIAGVEYAINVVAEDLDKVSLPINLWITNTGVVPTGWSNGTPSEFKYSDKAGNRRSIYTLKANYQGVYSENGIALNSILPETSGTATSSDGNYDVVYWKSAYHTAEHRQSTDGWTNNSHLGTEFTYIRYWNGSWAYSVDGSTWVNIENVGAEAADTKKNQVNLWYRQKTEITTEVETQIVDWGPVSYSANQCLLDFAVKYESGEQVPSSFPVTGKTMGFACPTDQDVPLGNGYVVKDTDGTYYRTVYGIAGVETADYEVYMITVTPSSDTHTTYINRGSTLTSYTYDGTEKIAWAKTEEDAKKSGLQLVSNPKYGGEPFLESVKIYQYQGLLVTYYVRAKATESALKVHYIIEATNEEFYNYSIAVNANTTFNEGFGLGQSVNELVNNTVINKNNIEQTVYADLSKIPEIDARYRYSEYTCTKVKLKNENKEVYLYYKFERTKTFVIDFGLQLKITVKGLLSETEYADNENVTVKSIELEDVSPFATVSVDNDKNIIYKLNKMISDKDTFSAQYVFGKANDPSYVGDSIKYTFNIIPATTVYYEDSFVDFYDAGSSAKKTEFTQTTAENDVMGVWYVEGNANTTAEQALSKLGDKAIYGYDPAYNNSTTFSMDSAKKVTVNTNGQYAQAKFTFKGTGFDVISLTNSDSGAITVEVLKDGTTAKTKDGKDAFYLVNNYYGYKQENGQWVVDPTATNTLYQIPVMKVSGLDYGTYTAVITVDYAKFFDKTNDNKYSFWLDAIRIYDPMGVDNETYMKDNEGFPQYIKLRDAVKAGATEANALLFIDGAENATISEYKNFGPNNEVYLATGQAISFKLAGDLNKIASVQIGAKAPNGNAATLVVNNGEPKEIATATEMYYDITEAAKNGGQVTIANNTGNILSLTNLKITYSAKGGSVSLAAMNAEEQTSAVMMVRAMFAPPAPTVFEPETFTVSLKNYKDVYVREYIKVTVTTSDDVKYITVGDKKISRYDDERVWGGFRKGFVKTGKRIWSYYVSFNTAGQQVISVVAYDADGLASEAVENTVNIKPRSAWRGKKSEWHI